MHSGTSLDTNAKSRKCLKYGVGFFSGCGLTCRPSSEGGLMPLRHNSLLQPTRASCAGLVG
jgi:hypothetical protein